MRRPEAFVRLASAAALAALLAGGLLAASPAAGSSGPLPAEIPRAELRVDTVEAGVVMPGDLIRLTIWGEEELSGELPVDVDGTVILPRVGRTEVAGRTPARVQAMVREELGAYIRTPAIEVTVLRTVKVLGAVTKPGLYNVDPSRSVRDAVAVAGGVSPVGNGDDIRVVRNGQVLAEDLRLQARLLDTPVRSGDEIYVPERSWFSRNTGAVISGAVGLLSVIAAIVVR